MSQREEQYLLNGEVDGDDVFVGGVSLQATGTLNPEGPLPHHGRSRWALVSTVPAGHTRQRMRPVRSDETGTRCGRYERNGKDRRHGGIGRLFRHWQHPCPDRLGTPWRGRGSSTTQIANLKSKRSH